MVCLHVSMQLKKHRNVQLKPVSPATVTSCNDYSKDDTQLQHGSMKRVWGANWTLAEKSTLSSYYFTHGMVHVLVGKNHQQQLVNQML